jgi:hypothetical protein
MTDTDRYHQLNRFVGKWNTEGRILSTDTTPEVPVTGTDVYEWLPGNFFLLHKAAVKIGDDDSQTFEVIGIDKKSKNVTMQYYDNKGESGQMIAIGHGDHWTFLGEHLKFTGGFTNGDKEFSGMWEQSVDGKTWNKFMEIRLTKIDRSGG